MRRRSRSALLALLPVTAALVLTASSGCRTIRAARILRDSQRPAHELTEGVRGDEVLVADVAVHLYRPSDESGPRPALLLCHGAVDTGARDPLCASASRPC